MTATGGGDLGHSGVMGQRRLVLLATLLGCAALGFGVGLWHLDAAIERAWREPAARPAEPPVAVLRGWDEQRAAAYARADEEALRGLYVAESGAGTRDVALLRRYRDHGLRVADMRTQVLAVEVQEESEDRLVLRVTDRLADGVAVGGGLRVTLPRDRATTRVLTLVRQEGEWRMAAVRAARLVRREASLLPARGSGRVSASGASRSPARRARRCRRTRSPPRAGRPDAR